MSEHPPGGHLISALAGQDVTKAFEDNNHSEHARSLLVDYFKGVLVASDVKQQDVKPADVVVPSVAAEPVQESTKSNSDLPSLKVFYGTQKGTARNFANRIVDEV